MAANTDLQRELERSFLGTAKVNLQAIRFDTLGNERELWRSLKPLEASLESYCDRENAENYAVGVVDSNLYFTGMQASDFPPDSIVVLHGQKRLQVARETLVHDDRWWPMELYSADLRDAVRLYVRNRSYASIGRSDAEIYRSFMTVRLTDSNPEAEGIWMSRLSAPKQKQFKQFLKRREYTQAFCRLLPVTGLWKAFSFGHLNRLNPMRCVEVG